MNAIATRIPGRFFTAETVVGASFLGVVALLMIPVPAAALDLLLALSIGIAAVVFLTALFSERPTDFSIFPTLLLISTLLRLSLNIASTRLILNTGHQGPHAAGRIIQAFSEFVVGGNMAVGLIVFLALIIINFVVITKGAGRIAEVSARFTLDALPGKQMSIDAELQAGTIDEAEAKKRREQLDQQADFYRSMDGANKFIRGDAIAGLIITAINLVGGLLLGMLQHNLAVAQAAETYSTLSIGDGLVSQMPALVVSTAAGLAMSRSTARSEFSREVVQQMLGIRNVLGIAAGFLLLIAFLPGLPAFPFMVLAGAMLYASHRQGKVAEAKAQIAAEEAAKPEPPKEETASNVLRVDPVSVEFGIGLNPIVNDPREPMTGRIKRLRKQLGRTMGFWAPTIYLGADFSLADNEYVIKLSGAVVARGTLEPGRLFLFNFTGDDHIQGIEAKDPVHGVEGLWIPADEKRRAEARGHKVIEPASIIITHLVETLKKNAPQLLRRDDVHELIEMVREQAPKLIDSLVPQPLGYGTIAAILRRLLEEHVSIRNLRTILETLSDLAPQTQDVSVLSEMVRTSLRSQITETLKQSGKIEALTIDAALEEELRASFGPNGQFSPGPRVQQSLVTGVLDAIGARGALDPYPCVVVPLGVRRVVGMILGTHEETAKVMVVKPEELAEDPEYVGIVNL